MMFNLAQIHHFTTKITFGANIPTNFDLYLVFDLTES